MIKPKNYRHTREREREREEREREREITRGKKQSDITLKCVPELEKDMNLQSKECRLCLLKKKSLRNSQEDTL